MAKEASDRFPPLTTFQALLISSAHGFRHLATGCNCDEEERAKRRSNLKSKRQRDFCNTSYATPPFELHH